MIGFGYDSHRFKKGNGFVLGGIHIDSVFSVEAHSDGDVLIHALIDALLGASGKGDIGTLFPDTDDKFKNIDSMNLLKVTLNLIRDFEIVNIDATVLLEQPKLIDYKSKIKNNLSKILDLDAGHVNIKAKTNEKMGFIGRNEGIACFCVVQLEKKK